MFQTARHFNHVAALNQERGTTSHLALCLIYRRRFYYPAVIVITQAWLQAHAEFLHTHKHTDTRSQNIHRRDQSGTKAKEQCTENQTEKGVCGDNITQHARVWEISWPGRSSIVTDNKQTHHPLLYPHQSPSHFYNTHNHNVSFWLQFNVIPPNVKPCCIKSLRGDPWHQDAGVLD